MTRLLTCGYETGDVAEAGISTIGTNSQITAVNSSPSPRAGGAYCLRMGPPTSGTTLNATTKAYTLPASKTDVWFRVGVYIHPVPSGELVIAQVQDSAGTVVNCLTWDSTTGALRVRQGASTGSTLLATGTGFAADSWHLVELREQFTSTTVGVTEVWVDGVQIINFSGDNTATTALANAQFLLLGIFAAQSAAAGMYIAFDDLAVNDTSGTRNNARVGDGRVMLLVPNGAGSSTVLARGGTDTGANYSQVNELPPSLVQYVGSSTVGDRDLYAMADLGVAVTSINCVEAIVLAQNSDASAGSIGPTIKSGATINEATAISLGTTAGYVSSRWETDPNTSAAWTASAVNAVEAGVTVR